MPSVRTLRTDDELSRQDAEDRSKDVRRILRRARYWIRQDHAIKRARPLIRRSAQNLAELLRKLREDDPEDEGSFEVDWALINRHRDRALDAVGPFVSFFRSHGLLPDEVTEDALLVHVLVEAERQGLLAWE